MLERWKQDGKGLGDYLPKYVERYANLTNRDTEYDGFKNIYKLVKALNAKIVTIRSRNGIR